MRRNFIAILLSVVLCFTTVACGSSETTQNSTNFSNNTGSVSRLTDGKYPVQQATYNDGDGEYNLMLLNTPAGVPPVYRSTNLQMARLTDEAIKNGEKTYLDVSGNQAVMYLTEDFRIEYVHNVTETQTNPQTGQPQTVVVRQESSFWTPFAGALAGQALGSLLFRPQYYVPPIYQPGVVLSGYGGYGSSYNQAVESYRTNYKTSPPAVTNRQTLRTSGSLRSTPSSSVRKPSTAPDKTKSTGSGYGSSDLRNSGKSSVTKRRTPSFGSSSGSRPRMRSGFGGRRR